MDAFGSNNIAVSSVVPAGGHARHESSEMAMTPNQIAEAYRASVTEHQMTFSEAFGAYKKALFWSAVMGLVS